MTDAEVIKIFKCLSDKSRLMIVKCLSKEPMYVELLAERLNLTPPTISFHLKKLVDVGIVYSTKEQYYVIYSLNELMLTTRIIDLIRQESSEEKIQAERELEYRNKVLESFMEFGKIKTIPVQRKKKRIIYEEIVKAFERGRKYSEKEVNLIIADFHDDFCTIRRDMISEGLLIRENSIYERI